MDNDSGMSSGENDDSMRYVYNRNRNVSDSLRSTVTDNVVTKCLTNNNRCAVLWNEIPIPSCSNVNNNNVLKATGPFRLTLDEADEVDGDGNNIIDSDFIVINVSCDVNNDVCDSRMCESVVGTNVYTVDCDNSSILNLDSNRSLVPVSNNELVKSESQKLVSLSLSILLAALLQAMRCFAQFLEDIVTPQRL
ncbi:uncharacterized protein LOC126772268 [Nymphalis io]|uniref:uncharacterized protein LOC126772268 n=1 Tax=Inachis io TaxID=171585 RepID=UPI00216A4324|nr:uncharacterized protein LOC126772268 [Nymphalis io]